MDQLRKLFTSQHCTEKGEGPTTNSKQVKSLGSFDIFQKVIFFFFFFFFFFFLFCFGLFCLFFFVNFFFFFFFARLFTQKK